MGKIINFHYYGEKKSFYRQDASGVHRSLLLELTHQRLCKVKKNELFPEILSAWEMKEEGRVWRFTLCKGLEFYKGRNVTLRDLEFGILYSLFSPCIAPERSFILQIKGATKIKPGTIYQEGLVEGVKKRGAFTLEIELEKANTSFLRNLCEEPVFGVYPSEEIDLEQKKITYSGALGSSWLWKTIPIGTGAFKVQKSLHNGCEVIVERKKQDKKLWNYLRLTSGKSIPEDTDILSGENIKDAIPASLSKYTVDLPYRLNGIYFNFQSEIVRDKRFRKALQLGICPQQVNNFFQEGKVNTSIIPSTWNSYQELDQKINKARAQELAQEVIKSYPQPIKLAYCSQEINHWTYQLKNEIEKLGFKTEYASVGDLLLVGFIPSVSSEETLFSLFKEGSAWVSQLSQRDNLYNQYLEKIAKNPLEKDIHYLQKRFSQEIYALPLVETKLNYWVSKSKISSLGEQGYTFSFDEIILNS